MKLHGWRRVMSRDGVEVLESAVAALPWHRLERDQFGSDRSRPADVGRLRTVLAPARSRWGRGRESDSEEFFNLGMADGSSLRVEGRVLADRPSDAARFLIHSLAVDPDDASNPVESLLVRHKGRLSEDDLARDLEALLVESAPPWFVLRDDFGCERVKIGTEVWYLERGFGTADFTAAVPLPLGQTALASGRVLGEKLFCFDGQTLHVVPAEGKEAQKLLTRFDSTGHIWSELSTDVLPLAHLEPITFLRIPTAAQVEAVQGELVGGSEALRGLPLPSNLPCAAYINDLFDPIPGLDSVTAVLDDPAEVLAVLARVDRGVYLEDTPPIPVDPAYFSEEPGVVVVTRLRL